MADNKFEENKKRLYDFASKDFDLGDFNSFTEVLSNETDRRALYDAVSKKYEDTDFGDWDSFNEHLGYAPDPSTLGPSNNPNGGDPNDPMSINFRNNAAKANEYDNAFNQDPANTASADTTASVAAQATGQQAPSAPVGTTSAQPADTANVQHPWAAVEQASNELDAQKADLEQQYDTIQAGEKNLQAELSRLQGLYDSAKTEEERKKYADEYKAVVDGYNQRVEKYQTDVEAYNKRIDEAKALQERITREESARIIPGSEKYSSRGGWSVGEYDEAEKLREEWMSARAGSKKSENEALLAAKSEDAADAVAASKQTISARKSADEAKNKYAEVAKRLTGLSDADKAIEALENFRNDQTAESIQPEVTRQIEALSPIMKSTADAYAQSVKDNMITLINDPYGSAIKDTDAYKQRSAAEVAMTLLNDAQRQLDNYNVERGQRGAGKARQLGQFAANTARGFGQKITDISTWDMGASDLMKAKALREAVEKKEAGQELTPAEQAVLDAAALNMLVMASVETGLGFQAGQVTAESIPFMLDMMIAPEASVGNSIASRVLRVALKQIQQKGLRSMLTTQGGRIIMKRLPIDLAKQELSNLGRGLLMTMRPTQIMKTEANVLNEYMGNAVGNMDENGHYIYSGQEGGHDMVEALFRGIGQQAIENSSEFAGDTWLEGIGSLMKASGGRMMNAPLNYLGIKMILNGHGKQLNAIKKSWNAFIGGLDKLSKNDYIRAVNELRSRAHISGAIGETNEEIVGGIYNMLPFIGDEKAFTYYDENGEEKNGVLSVDNYLETMITMLPQQIVMGALGGFSYGASKTKAYSSMSRSLADLRKFHAFEGKSASEIKAMFDALEDTGDYGKALLDMAKSEKDAAARIAIMRFGIDRQYFNAMDEAERLDRMHDIFYAAYGNAYDRGLQMTDPAEIRDAYHIQTALNVWIDTYIGNVSEDVRNNPAKLLDEAVRMYGANSKAAKTVSGIVEAQGTWRGVYDARMQQVADRQAEFDASIDMQTHKDGNIYEAKTADGTTVYVVDGNMAYDQNGSISGSYMVYNPETNEKKMVDASSITMSAEPISAQQAKQSAHKQILDEENKRIQDMLEIVQEPQIGQPITINGMKFTPIAHADGVWAFQSEYGVVFSQTDEEVKNAQLADYSAHMDELMNGITGYQQSASQDVTDSETEQPAEGGEEAPATEPEQLQTTQGGVQGGAVQYSGNFQRFMMDEPIELNGGIVIQHDPTMDEEDKFGYTMTYPDGRVSSQLGTQQQIEALLDPQIAAGNQQATEEEEAQRKAEEQAKAEEEARKQAEEQAKQEEEARKAEADRIAAKQKQFLVDLAATTSNEQIDRLVNEYGNDPMTAAMQNAIENKRASFESPDERRQKSKEEVARISAMSDEELLAEMAKANFEENDENLEPYFNEYDGRHRNSEEYLKTYEDTLAELEGKTRQQVLDLKSSNDAEWRNGGFKTKEKPPYGTFRSLR